MTFVRRSATAALMLNVVFTLSAFILLAFRGETIDFYALLMGVTIAALMLIFYNVTNKIFKYPDRIVLVCCITLVSIGLIMQYRISPETGWKQLLWFVSGIVAMYITIMLFKSNLNLGKVNWLLIAATAGLLLMALVFARVIGGAKNWIKIGPFSFQPSEFAKITFLVSAAYYFSKKDTIMSLLPYAIFSGACILILVVSKDLGAAMLFALSFLIIFFVSTGSKLWTLGGIGVLGVGAVLSYKFFSHVRIRVEIWQDPWAVYYGQGYQIVQGLMAIASGSFFGTGLSLGTPKSIPANSTDFIFAVICEEFGIIFGTALIILYLVFILRGALIALNARNKNEQLLVFGCTAMLSLQCFIIIAGVIKMIPLTGITLPFISYGGSSMWSCMILVGIIQGIAVKNGIKDVREIRSIGGDVI